MSDKHSQLTAAIKGQRRQKNATQSNFIKGYLQARQQPKTHVACDRSKCNDFLLFYLALMIKHHGGKNGNQSKVFQNKFVSFNHF